VIIDTW